MLANMDLRNGFCNLVKGVLTCCCNCLGSEPLIQLREILLRAPGVYGARFSGAGFRGCCVALVDTDHAKEAASFVREEYSKVQPELASQLNQDTAVMICETGDCARVI
ncbi:hypothetical protein ACFXTN_011861 [Malus domestica]